MRRDPAPPANAEDMWAEASGGPQTAHTTGPVPVVYVAPELKGSGRRIRAGGRLADVAPTLLARMGLSPSPQMEGKPLLE